MSRVESREAGRCRRASWGAFWVAPLAGGVLVATVYKYLRGAET
ncbi:MAG TPA: hypothetical protein VF862_14970 [Gemmatimonadales bacterium]